MSLRRQTNVSLPLDTAAVVERFARVFHRGEFAAAARILIEEGLLHIKDEADYLRALKRSALGESESRSEGEGTNGKPKSRK